MINYIDAMVQFLDELKNSNEEFITIDDVHVLSENFLRISIMLAKSTISEEIFHQAVTYLWELAPDDSIIMLPPAGEA